MFNLNLEFINNSDEEDVLSAYRERLIYRFAIIFIAIFLPLMIFNFLRGQNSLGAALGCLLVILSLNAAAIYFEKSVPIARTAFIVGLAALVGIALINRGAYGTYWAYPIVIFISFSVTLRLARIYTGIFFVYCSLMMFYLLDSGLALRAIVGLGITILFTNVFLGIIEKLQEKLVEQSSHDPLTGAFNRRQMTSCLEEAIERKHRTHTPASILVFDIDNFKNINDSYGHAVGDHVLKEFVALVTNRSRRLDKLFRVGGEEFMLLLPDTPANGALTLAQDICGMISKADFIENRPVTVSIGLSELQAGETIDDWLKHGDNALYSAKENGRNQVFSRKNPIISGCINIGQDTSLNAAVFVER